MAPALVGTAAGAPGEEPREIGLQISAAQHAVGDCELVQDQHPAIPHLGLAAPHLCEMPIDLGSAASRERPGLWCETELELLEGNQMDAGHETNERCFARKVQAPINP